MRVQRRAKLADDFTFPRMGGLASTHQFQQPVSMGQGAMLAYAAAQIPIPTLCERTAHMLLDADFQRLAHIAPAHGDSHILLTRFGVGDAVHRMGGVLAALAVGVFLYHVHSIANGPFLVNLQNPIG